MSEPLKPFRRKRPFHEIENAHYIKGSVVRGEIEHVLNYYLANDANYSFKLTLCREPVKKEQP